MKMQPLKPSSPKRIIPRAGNSKLGSLVMRSFRKTSPQGMRHVMINCAITNLPSENFNDRDLRLIIDRYQFNRFFIASGDQSGRIGGDFLARPERPGLALAYGHGLPLPLK